jgi:hypothetical protein
MDQLWSALRQLQRTAKSESENFPGRPLSPASLINGWSRIGLGIPAMLVTAAACWVISGGLVLMFVGWGAAKIWFAGAPTEYPACYLRTPLWNDICLVLCFVAGVCRGSEIRWWIMETAEPNFAQLKKMLWLPHMISFCVAVFITGAVVLAATFMSDLPQTFARECASIRNNF